jgi:Glycosyl transferases group 1
MNALEALPRPVRRAGRRAMLAAARGGARLRRADLAVFHDFQRPPGGGGHQALRAVLDELGRRGVRIGSQAVSPTTRACLFNSFNFDPRRLEFMASRAPDGCRMVHRVGAVTSLYRGFDDGTDALVADLNHRFADATLAVSQATIEMYRSIGIELVRPQVVHNACDPRIFHPGGRVPFRRDRKIRLIASSWSDNPKKGAPTYRRLEQHLDWSRFEFTFVGRTQVPFERIRHVRPVPSNELADLLREHDVYVTATEHDAYSNALVEALSCGLPALYLDSGGSGEAVKDAGFAFAEPEEIPALLERLVDEYEDRQAAIALPTLGETADGYLRLLGLDEFVQDG